MDNDITPKNNNPLNTTPPSSNSGVGPTNIPVSQPSAPQVSNPMAASQPPKKRGKKFLTVLLILVLLLGGAAAAWYFMNSNKSDTSTNSQTSELQEIEHLKVASVSGPASTFFPDEGLLGIQTILDHQVYEGLVGFDGPKIIPLIAESWTNPDETTWVFKIRSGVKFHTGKAVTAKEVKASLDNLKKYDYWSLFVSTIKSTEATGDLELTIKTKEPDALLLNRLVRAFISDLSAKDKAGNDGTGSYQLDTASKNDKNSSTLIAFDDYYGQRAKTRKVTYTIYKSDAEAIKAFKDGKADVVETLPYANVTSEMKEAGYSSTETEGQGVFGMYVNQLSGPNVSLLKKKDMRLAIAQMLDRQGLVDKVGNKNVVSTQVIPKSMPGYDASIEAPKLDLDAAKASLKKAGYNNEALEFVYIKEVQEDAPVIIAQLKKGGLNIKPVVYDADHVDEALTILQSGKFDLFLSAYLSDFGDARDILGGIMHSKESTYPTVNDATYDKILTDSDKEFDATKRIALLQEANNYISDNLSWFPLRNSVYASFHKPNLVLENDFNGNGSVGVYYRNVGTKAE